MIEMIKEGTDRKFQEMIQDDVDNGFSDDISADELFS